MMIGAIIQARMSSVRLPGKVLMKAAGRTVLQYVIERLKQCAALDGIVVATSTDDRDMAIVNHCEELGVAVCRGSLENVARRSLEAAERFGFGAFVRVCADSPLLDADLVGRAVEHFRACECDVVTNVMPRTYPHGQSVEVVRTELLRATWPKLSTPEHLEHVMSFFYEHRSDFSIVNLCAPRDMSDMRLVVDTEEDWERFTRIADRFEEPHWKYGLAEIIVICESLGVCGVGQA
ncbi:MAG: NTP transferase domain-containing protein [Planctomycetota bacterium]|nr:NTP transferase domain-containing protein [Planctomycetota bacterium]